MPKRDPVRDRADRQYRFRGAVLPTKAVKRPVKAEKTSGGTGVLHLDDVIDSWGGDWGISAREFTAALDELGDVDRIDLHINSPGGEVWEGIAMLNALRRHPAQVTAVVDGLAASAASFIAAGADRTIMAPNTELMIHDAWGIALGPAVDMRAMAERLDSISDNIASVYAAKAGADVATWRGFMLAETWYTADEAVAAGLADEIEGAAPTPDDTIADAFDLGVFKHPGRAQAPTPPPAGSPAPPRILEEPAVATDAEAIDERRARMADRRAGRHQRRAAAR